MNPVEAFLKYAAKQKQRVSVKEHVRRLPGGGETIVDAHERLQDDVPDDILIGQDNTPIETLEKELADEFDEVSTTDAGVEQAEPRIEVGDYRKDLSTITRNKYERLSKEQELELWRKWKDGGKKPEDLEPLVHSFGSIINHKAGTYKGRVRMIPDAAIQAEYTLQFVAALDSYNPEKGALGTYVYSYLDKSKRFIGENQNIGRIPENRIYKIKEFLKARDELSDTLGVPPSIDDLSKHLKWPKGEVERMDAELRNDLLSQGFEEDPFAIVPSKSEEIIKLFKYELSGDERTVYEYLTGYGRPQVSSTGEIASKMKIPAYQVSRYKDSIQKKLKKYVED